MIEKGLITSFFVLLSAGCIKATTLGMKLFIIACAGLAGMYMIHLLAQDYNKYQTLNRPGRSVHQLAKRSLGEGIGFFDAGDSSVPRNLSEDIKRAENRYTRNELLNLDRVLQFDPLGCARRYVCTIASKSVKKLTQTENNIIRMLRSLPAKSQPDSGQAAFKRALDLGRSKRDAQACADEYPKCFLTISQMLKLVGFQ